MFRKRLFLFALFACFALLGTASAQVMINEIYYDNQGADDPNLIFTELYGPEGTSLNGWSLVGTNCNTGSVYRTVNLSGTIPEDHYFVIANSANVANFDLNLNAASGAGIDWENAGSSTAPDCDKLVLMNGATIVDLIVYGVCAHPENCTGENGTSGPDYTPSGGINKSIGRNPDHQDTNDNGADWQIIDNPSPGAANSGTPCNPQIAVLEEIRSNDANGVPVMMGDFAVVRGIVNVSDLVFDTLANFCFQDDNAGANVFRGTVPAGIVAGDCVVVSAWVTHFNGLTEFVSSGVGNCPYEIAVVGHVAAPAPIPVTCDLQMEQYEGMLVQFDNLDIISGTWPGTGQYANLTVNDGTGSITLRIVPTTNIDGSPQPDPGFSCIGIIEQYDISSPYTSGYELMPRSLSDINTDAADDHLAAGRVRDFRLNGCYPNPFNNATRINFEVGSARELSLAIFDLLGRQVSSEKLTGLTPGIHSYSWSPALASSGLFIVRLSGSTGVQTAKVLYLK